MSGTATPRLLAFDTSTETMAVAVVAPHGTWARNVPGGAQASAGLLPLARALLAEAGLTLRELDAVAFGRGPGAFTGLRTACAVAQGLAFGLGRPVLSIDSLLVVAEGARASVAADAAWDVVVAMDARMNEAYAGRYRHGGLGATDGWQTLREPVLTSPEALADLWVDRPPQAVAGSAWAAFADRVQPPPGVPCVDADVDRAAALARLAQAAWLRGERLDAAQALPLYLRDKVALTTAEREALRASPAA